MDFEAIANQLSARLVGHRPLVGGVSARVVALTLAHPDDRTEQVVVRIHPTSARDAVLLRVLGATDLPVVAPLMAREEGAETFVVMPFVEGTTEIAEPVSAVPKMAALLARVHDQAVADLPETLPRRDDPVPELREYLPERYAATLPALEAAAERLEPQDCLLHGDFWPGNLLWRDGEVVALIDWEDAARGDPLSDLACARQELSWSHGAEACASFTEHYAALRGPVSPEGLAVWDAYVAAAALAFMGRWGLDPEDEAGRRRVSHAFLAAALEP